MFFFDDLVLVIYYVDDFFIFLIFIIFVIYLDFINICERIQNKL